MPVLSPLGRRLGLGMAAGWPDLSQGTIGHGGGQSRGEMRHRDILHFWALAALNLGSSGAGLRGRGWTASPSVTGLSHLAVGEALWQPPQGHLRPVCPSNKSC